MPKQISLFNTLQNGEKIAGGVLRCIHRYEDIISVENLLAAWEEFRRGKRKRVDVLEFQSNLMTNILSLHQDLKNKTYYHGSYQHFIVTDPKRRDIHKASVRDRLVHHAIYRILYPYFDSRFIYDSYSCRNGKGTHRAMNQFRCYAREVSKNHTQTCWVLKCDIRKFFASIDHDILIKILAKHVADGDVLQLLQNIIESFHTETEQGLPLGNLTSQLLVNVYMNEFDKFVKRELKVKYYIRYADDFVLLNQDRKHPLKTLSYMIVFLRDKLKLELHPSKVSVSTFTSGVDFLGWVHFTHHRVLRTVTKRLALKGIQGKKKDSPIFRSYLACYRTEIRINYKLM